MYFDPLEKKPFLNNIILRNVTLGAVLGKQLLTNTFSLPDSRQMFL